MHDIVFIEHLERVDKLLENQQCVLLRDDPFLPEHTLQSAPITVLVNKVKVIRSLEHVDVLDDVLMLLNVRKYVDLVDRTLLQLLVFLKPPHFDYLNSVLLVIVFVYGSIHLPIGTLTDYLVQGVVLDDAYHARFKYYCLLCTLSITTYYI